MIWRYTRTTRNMRMKRGFSECTYGYKLVQVSQNVGSGTELHIATTVNMRIKTGFSQCRYLEVHTCSGFSEWRFLLSLVNVSDNVRTGFKLLNPWQNHLSGWCGIVFPASKWKYIKQSTGTVPVFLYQTRPNNCLKFDRWNQMYIIFLK